MMTLMRSTVQRFTDASGEYARLVVRADGRILIAAIAARARGIPGLVAAIEAAQRGELLGSSSTLARVPHPVAQALVRASAASATSGCTSAPSWRGRITYEEAP